MGRFRVLAYSFLLASAALGADDLTLLTRAVADYERVELSDRPNLKDAIACVQSQAALLPVTRPSEQYLVHFRKGVCEMVAGRLRNSRDEYRDAVTDFEQAFAKWPARSRSGEVPVTAGLRVSLAMGKVHAAEEPNWSQVSAELRSILAEPNCPGTLLMSSAACQEYVHSGRLWLGWALYRQGEFDAAAKALESANTSPWGLLVQGRRALAQGHHEEAAGLIERALQAWAVPRTGVRGLLAPEIDEPGTRYRLARALYGGRRYAEAISAVEASLKLRPRDSAALYLRARARETQGLEKEALADFDLASRAAFADAGSTSGAAHFYRGIAQFRRGDFERAESSFASALNFEAPSEMGPDIQAWRHIAAVANGGCEASAPLLQESIPRTSILFPKEEAETLLRTCQTRVVTQKR
jgi:tetratricopeptide (TPR) repeat protein